MTWSLIDSRFPKTLGWEMAQMVRRKPRAVHLLNRRHVEVASGPIDDRPREDDDQPRQVAPSPAPAPAEAPNYALPSGLSAPAPARASARREMNKKKSKHLQVFNLSFFTIAVEHGHLLRYPSISIQNNRYPWMSMNIYEYPWQCLSVRMYVFVVGLRDVIVLLFSELRHRQGSWGIINSHRGSSRIS